ncbi:hypothetical protein LTR37_004246 [Vermiconidia calcicola]|uniref:Uncharacterized protein n=1 Tax=Vermiconidia calcicola TaxID=1690605 RepID=A0ACC3NMP6_9PEZI|nr:hypothetical protein LTR37_004246 [Vermiconidia calcicola]
MVTGPPATWILIHYGHIERPLVSTTSPKSRSLPSIQMLPEATPDPCTHKQLTHIYIVKIEQRISNAPNLAIHHTHSAHGSVGSAESEAEGVAAQHRAFRGSEQRFSWPPPDCEKCWRTTYRNGLWKEVRVERVRFVVDSPGTLDR